MSNNALKDEKSLFLRDNDKRKAVFQRNVNLEILLTELSQYLGPLELEIEKRFVAPSMPPCRFSDYSSSKPAFFIGLNRSTC